MGGRGKLQGWVLSAAVILILVLWMIIHLATEWLWYQEVGFTQVFTVSLVAQGKAGLLLGGIFFLCLYINFILALRLSRMDRVVWWKDTPLPTDETIRKTVKYLTLMLGILAVISGTGGAENLLLFMNGVTSGIKEPLLKRDASFYIFTLPFLRQVYGFLMAAIIVAGIGTIALYTLRGAIVPAVNLRFHFSSPARLHLLILACIFFVILAIGYWLSLANLPFVRRGVVYGAGYADATTQVWVLYLLMALSLLTCLAVIYTIIRRSWQPSLVMALLLILCHIVGRGIYPVIVHKFVVVPNEITCERPYLEYNIKFTRLAYGLDNIEEREFSALDNLSLADIQRNSATIKNIRLWDYAPLLQTFSQLQEIRTYYKFLSVDNDRYVIENAYRQVMLSPRELSYNALPSRTWVNEHLTYTHGYGLVMSPVNRISKEGLPEFFIKDIPPISTIDITVRRPEIYFGETATASTYVFVNTKRPEFDYPIGEKNVYTRYQGTGGIQLSLWRKLLFAVRFKSLMVLLSNDITSESRIMYYRNIEERIGKVAPFVRLDPDPYLVISPEGRLLWIVDGYTVTDHFPYSEPFSRGGNYIRNSLKAVVDAYDGKITLYMTNDTDPLIKTYARIYPGILRPLAEMPSGLRRHLRYPPALLSVQASMYRVYHMKDPQVFYNKEDIWTIPHLPQGGEEQEMKPYYTIMKLPQEAKEEYILLLPFTPARKDNMSAWMAARCDDPNYGKVIVYTFPKQRLVYGPRQIAARINQDAYISQQLSLWNQRGSHVIMGNLLAIPIEQSIIYVQPIFLASEKSQLPELKRIILAYGNVIVMEENLEEALNRVFGGDVTGRPQPITEARPQGPPKHLRVKDALTHWRQAQEYLRQGNWAAFGEALKKMEGILTELEREER